MELMPDFDVLDLMLHPFFSRRLAAWGGKPERAAFVLRETGCVEWVGATNSKGYPIDGRGLLHRQAWTALVGPIPPDHDIHHLCRNKLCSRHIACLSHVDHAELENANRKIDEWILREILFLLRDGVKQKDIAANFGISQSYVSKIRRGIRWENVSRKFWEEKHYDLSRRDTIEVS
jgi:hypothetical protein